MCDSQIIVASLLINMTSPYLLYITQSAFSASILRNIPPGQRDQTNSEYFILPYNIQIKKDNQLIQLFTPNSYWNNFQITHNFLLNNFSVLVIMALLFPLFLISAALYFY
jgi:hypothetical protein